MTEERDINKIVVEYDNGDNEEITKGFIVGLNEVEENLEICYKMCNISGNELKLVIIMSVLELARQLGMFNNEE